MDHSRRTGNIIELALNPVYPGLKPVHPGFNPVHPALKPVHPALNAGHMILERLLDFGDLLVDGWESYEYLKVLQKEKDRPVKRWSDVRLIGAIKKT